MMYAAVHMDHNVCFETDQSDTVLDPESSETVEESSEIADSVEDQETEEEDSTADTIEGENDVHGSGDENNSVSVQSSSSDLSLDNHSDVSDLRDSGSDDTELQEEEETSDGSHAGSDTDTEEGTGSYRITIEGDPEEVGELIRLLNRGEEDGDNSVNDESGDIESSGNTVTSGNGENSTESSASVSEVDSDADEFYFKNIELLGIIAGCLFFIVVVIVLRYIYRFFRLFF